MRFIQCTKLGQKLQGFDKQPWPGELGQRILAEISQDAWRMWLEHAKMLINEYRLNLGDDEARAFMTEQMKAFLFDEGKAVQAEGYVPEETSEEG